MRKCGILLAISSLPSEYGIGTIGKSAYRFIDFLRKAGQRCWQILPINPVSFGNSPYQSFSAFAFNSYYIDLDELPGPIVKTEDELIKAIKNATTDHSFDEKYEKFNAKFNYLDDGQAAKRVTEAIIEEI